MVQISFKFVKMFKLVTVGATIALGFAEARLDIVEREKLESGKCFNAVLKGNICNRVVRRLVPLNTRFLIVRLKEQNVFYPTDSDQSKLPLIGVRANKDTKTVWLKYDLAELQFGARGSKAHTIGQTNHSDVDGLGTVGEEDLIIVLRKFGQENIICEGLASRADINGDGKVDDEDLLAVLFRFGEKSTRCILRLVVSRR